MILENPKTKLVSRA